MKPRISVCIANYNGVGLINACIESVLGQDVGADVEIIIHDDASSDGSAAHIRDAHPGIQLIESTDNVGFCIANNRMAAAARGDYLLLLNNDAELMPDALQALLAASQEIGRPAILTLPQYDHETGDLIDRGCLLDPFFNPIPNLQPERQDVAMVMGACLWIPRALWQELGGFPEWFESIAEDMYLCCCARLAGYPVKALATSGYRHRVGASFGGGKVRDGGLATTYRRRALSERNKTWVMYICLPGPLLLPFFPTHLFLLTLEGSILALARANSRIWKQIYFPVYPATWQHRQQIRSLRGNVQAARRLPLDGWLRDFQWLPRKVALILKYGLPRVD